MTSLAYAKEGIYDPEELMTLKQYLNYRFGITSTSFPTREDQEDVIQPAEIELFTRSDMFAISNYMKTADKDGNLVLIRPYCGQAILDYTLTLQQKLGYPMRVYGVKSRQVGWSTWMLGKLLKNSLKPNRRAMFLVPDEEVATTMAGRLGTMVNSLPMHLQAMRRIQNLKHIKFDNPNAKDRVENPGLDSEIIITVPAPMRGIPPSYLVISEYSHMTSEAQFEVQNSIVPAIPMRANTMVVIDTTPNGFDDFYHPAVMDSCKRNKKWMRRIEYSKEVYTTEQILGGVLGEPERPDRMLVAFEPWRWHEEYDVKGKANPRGELTPPRKDTWKEFISDIGKDARYGGEEEVELRQQFGVSDTRLYWRRTKIDSYEMPTESMRLETFHQEFGNTINEAFVASGGSAFDRECLSAVMRQERPPSAVGLLRAKEGIDANPWSTYEVDTTCQSPWQELRVYSPPKPGEQYTIGVDCNNAFESQESDATVAAVMRFSDNKLCAIYTARVPEHDAKHQIYLLYRWYFNAYTGVEIGAGGYGYSLIRILIEMGLRNYYAWKRMDSENPEPTKYPGWQTDSRTRPMLDAHFATLLCNRDPNTHKPAPLLTIQDKIALQEIQSLTRQSEGGVFSVKSQNGKDDHYDAICIALELMRDPWSGLFKKRPDEPHPKEENEFNRLFKAGGFMGSRNRPNLANI